MNDKSILYLCDSHGHLIIIFLKKLDKLIITSFIGPTILSYFIATFVLVMQFLWKYIDEILGKGFTILELLELIMYYAITLIPLAVPITILIASVMVFGDMAEKYELSSMKSAGVSLIRIMAPGFFIALLIGFYSLLASNFFKPAASLQFQKRLRSLTLQKSSLSIEEGIFNDAFGETIIRINKIDENGKDIHDVILYDHTQNDKSLTSILTAKGGEMYTADKGKFFVMKLDSGVQYRELERKFNAANKKSEIPFTRTYFDHWTKMLDMSIFNADEGVLNFNRHREDMMNTGQLLTSLDTFSSTIRRNKSKMSQRIDMLFDKTLTTPIKKTPPTNLQDSISNITLTTSTHSNLSSNPPINQGLKAVSTITTNQIGSSKDSIRQLSERMDAKYNQYAKKVFQLKKQEEPKKIISQSDEQKPVIVGLTNSNAKGLRFIDQIDSIHRSNVLTKAISGLSNARDEMLTLKNINYDYNRMRQKHLLRLNQQYSWATVCIVFLFIGAPLGSIIRKGGYGYPLLVAILFYMIFIISTIFGEKLVKNESIGGIKAAWLPCMILVPFAVILTIIALRDIKFDFSLLSNFLQKFRSQEGSMKSKNIS